MRERFSPLKKEWKIVEKRHSGIGAQQEHAGQRGEYIGEQHSPQVGPYAIAGNKEPDYADPNQAGEKIYIKYLCSIAQTVQNTA